MTYLDLTLPSLEANLALDEALLLEAETGNLDQPAAHRADREMLRTWEWPTLAVVLGAACKLAEDANEEACGRDGVPLARRSSGGGTVLLGKGCLCFSLVLSYDRAQELTEVPSSYRYILGLISKALSASVPGIEPAGTSDLALLGRKVSGNSQQRKRRHLLHHGTILYQFELEPVERYLLVPQRQPEYRRQRRHGDFLTNLPLAAEELKRILSEVWQADKSASGWPADLVRRLVDEKYSRREWLRRR